MALLVKIYTKRKMNVLHFLSNLALVLYIIPNISPKVVHTYLQHSTKIPKNTIVHFASMLAFLYLCLEVSSGPLIFSSVISFE